MDHRWKRSTYRVLSAKTPEFIYPADNESTRAQRSLTALTLRSRDSEMIHTSRTPLQGSEKASLWPYKLCLSRSEVEEPLGESHLKVVQLKPRLEDQYFLTERTGVEARPILSNSSKMSYYPADVSEHHHHHQHHHQQQQQQQHFTDKLFPMSVCTLYSFIKDQIHGKSHLNQSVELSDYPSEVLPNSVYRSSPRNQAPKTTLRCPLDSSQKLESSLCGQPALVLTKKRIECRQPLKSSKTSVSGNRCKQKQNEIVSYSYMYTDPMIGAPVSFQRRISEIVALEQETVQFEKRKKPKKQPVKDWVR